jgi:hypothetical protein
MKVFAYYYPGFFDDEYRISGSEWNVVKSAKPRNERHYQPRIPVGGYYNQCNPDNCKAQIELAMQYGINGFMICYYWDFESSQPIMNQPLENLMEVIKDFDFEFNLMWVLRLPHRNLPIENGDYGNYNNHPWLKKRIQPYRKDPRFEAEIKRICAHPSYRKDHSGKAIFQVYSLSEIIDLHRDDAVNILSQFNDYHIQAVCGRVDNWIEETHTLGIDSLTTYVTLVDFDSHKIVLKHADCVGEQPEVWKKICSRTDVPFYPSVASGWDASPRGTYASGFKIKKFPWSPIVIDANPADFAKNLLLAKDLVLKNGADIHIASWNEWSEGHYIEPDQKFGNAFLEKVASLKH